jgi:hypothetical protein
MLRWSVGALRRVVAEARGVVRQGLSEPFREGAGGSVLRWSVRSPWRAVAEFVERFCETSGRGLGEAHRGVPRESPLPPRRVVPWVSKAWAETLGAVVAAVPRDCPRGLRKPPDGSPRSLPWVSRQAPPSRHRGSRQAPFQGLRRAHQGRPAGAFERPLLGLFRVVSGRVKEVIMAAVERSARGLRTSS